MNKITSKNKGCANKKSSPNQQKNGAQTRKSEDYKTDIEELKLKAKSVIGGILNGTDINHSMKTENVASQTTDKLEFHESCSNDLDEDANASLMEMKAKQKLNDDFNSPDFDITLLIRNKYKNEPEAEILENVTSELDDLHITESKSEEVQPVANDSEIEYVAYQSELQMPLIMKIIQKGLSEPYSIYTYRYFIHNWPNLCFLAMCDDLCVGAIVCKLDIHRKVIKRGYIAMLAVDKTYRKHGIGSTLVKRAIQEMISGDADEVVLETEITNKPALRLYEALGFVRDKRLFRYYLNGVDALRLKLWLR